MPGLVEKIREMWNPAEEYEEDKSNEDSLEVESSNSLFSQPLEGKNEVKGKVVNIHAASKLKIVLCRPERFGEDIKNIADDLLKMHTVVLNLELAPKSESRRLVDFLSGIAYAIGGKIKKVSADNFVVTPRNVEIEGEDILAEVENRGMYF